VPTAPGSPGSPANPAAPVAPVAPVSPVAPGAPPEPVAPDIPVAPVSPVSPVSPANPVEPSAPPGPGSPARPAGPRTPACPRRPRGPGVGRARRWHSDGRAGPTRPVKAAGVHDRAEVDWPSAMPGVMATIPESHHAQAATASTSQRRRRASRRGSIRLKIAITSFSTSRASRNRVVAHIRDCGLSAPGSRGACRAERLGQSVGRLPGPAHVLRRSDRVPIADTVADDKHGIHCAGPIGCLPATASRPVPRRARRGSDYGWFKGAALG
jgi:hypothetical protein